MRVIDDDRLRWADQVKREMASQGLSRERLAARIPARTGKGNATITEGTLSRWINEGTVTLEDASKVARALGFPNLPSFLLGERVLSGQAA